MEKGRGERLEGRIPWVTTMAMKERRKRPRRRKDSLREMMQEEKGPCGAVCAEREVVEAIGEARVGEVGLLLSGWVVLKAGQTLAGREPDDERVGVD